ncbi:MAG TPA: STAS domain-containing protein [Bacilli bacterium]
MSSNKFQIHKQETDQDNVLNLSGELDLSVAPQFHLALEPVVKQQEKTLILNFKDLKYIDSTGIGIIISVLKIRDELQAPFIVREIPPTIKRLFDLTGVSEFLYEGKENEA